MATIIACGTKALDRSIDVSISVSKDQVETTTDLSVQVFNTTDAPFRHGAERIQFYTSIDQVSEVWNANQEPRKAAGTFFSQTPRATTFAVAKIFTTAQAGYARCGAYNSTIADWAAVSDGAFKIPIDGVNIDVTACDFSAVTVFADVVAEIQARLTVALAGATVEDFNGTLIFTSDTTGATSTVGALLAPTAGTDISGPGFINGFDDPSEPLDGVTSVNGYTPTGNIADELDLVAEAARCSGRFVYAYTFEKSYRDSTDQIDAAQWMESRDKGIVGLTVNSPLVIDPNSTTDIGYQLDQLGLKRTFSVYHDNSYYYPEVGILAIMLSVNYAAEDSTITAKFKDVQGIPTAQVDVTDVGVLESKRVNTFTAVGNDARTYREGVQVSTTYYMDDLINLDNYAEELQVALYNVFLQNNKIPYTPRGLALQQAAIDSISGRYVRNGAFAERLIEPESAGSNKVLVEPAYTATPASIASMTASERASRIGPPWTIDVNLAGAIHSTSVTVNASA